MQKVPIVPEAEWILPYTMHSEPDSRTKSASEGTPVRDCLPPTFEAYGKLFHPLYMVPSVQDEGPWSEASDRPNFRGHLICMSGGAYPQGERLTWQEMCNRLGLVFHPELTRQAIQRKLPDNSFPRNMYGPDEGTIDAPTTVYLASVLAEYTSQEDAYFYYDPSQIDWKLESRMLLWGKLSEVEQCFHLETNELAMSPCFWWSSTREWCIASDYDLPYSLIGGSEALIERLAADEVLEVLPISLDARVDYQADRINVD